MPKLLHLSSFLFATTIHNAFICQDFLYHNACLTLTCLSIATHWTNGNLPIIRYIKTLDHVVAHLCFALCSYTYITEAYNADVLYLGFIFPSIISSLWIYEINCNDIELMYKIHLLLHILSVIALNIAISIRYQNRLYLGALI